MNPSSLYTKQLQQIATTILNNILHLLHSEFQLLPSGWKFSVPSFRMKRYKNTFVPAAITLVNKL